ncbi:hypothetical protein BH09VER1_BH09VER1_38240 [soil metagenome]
MSLRNARGNKSQYDYATHKTSWPEWERRQKWLLVAMLVGAFLICLGLAIVLLLTK